MSTHRKGRVAEEIKKEMAEIIRDGLKDPRIKGLVSVTHAEVSRDFSAAVIYISCLGSAEEQKDTMSAFRQAAGFIRGELAGRMNLRITPELTFKLDQSIQIGARINELLRRQAAEGEEA